MPQFKCPECREEIDTLDFDVAVAESGTCSITDDGRPTDWNTYDSEWTDEPTYRCPSCEYEIDPENLIEEEDDENHSTPSNTPAITGTTESNETTWTPAMTLEAEFPTCGNACNEDDIPIQEIVDFCTQCHELKQKNDLTEGICSRCLMLNDN